MLLRHFVTGIIKRKGYIRKYQASFNNKKLWWQVSSFFLNTNIFHDAKSFLSKIIYLKHEKHFSKLYKVKTISWNSYDVIIAVTSSVMRGSSRRPSKICTMNQIGSINLRGSFKSSKPQAYGCTSQRYARANRYAFVNVVGSRN